MSGGKNKPMACSKCGKTQWTEVDRETDVKGNTFILIECAECKRCVILPEDEAKKSLG